MGTLRGQVTGETQQGRYVPLSGAIVEVYSSGGTLWTTAFTDANGNYTLSGVPEQTSYDLRASYANYEEQWQRRVWIGTGATVTVNFALRVSRGTQNAPPDTFITSGPAEGAVVSNSSVTFGWTGTDERPNTLQYSYRIEGGGWSLFSSATSRTFNNLANGSHVFEVKARDDLGLEDPTPAQRRFFVSVSPVTNQPPETYITGGPSGTVQSSSVTFQWTGSDDRTPTSQLQYAYQMDSQGWSAWSALTAQSFVVGAGQHTFQVKARDAEGLEDPTPATRIFAVSTNQPPETEITEKPSGVVASRLVTFRYRGRDDRTPPERLRFAYRLDGGAWSIWTYETTKTFNRLSNGQHTFEVKAMDEEGAEDPTPAGWTFTVNVAQPPDTVITEGPSGTVETNEVTFRWTGNDDTTPVASLEYAYHLDSTAWSAWSHETQATFTGLSDGPHVFEVKARDAEGAEDPTPAQRFFTVRTNQPPETYIDPPSPAEGGSVLVSMATFYWHGTDDRTPANQLQYSYRLWLGGQTDPPAWSAWTTETSATFADLVNGLHTFEVKAKDGDGLEDPTPAKRTFVVDDPIEVEFLWPKKDGEKVGPWHLNDPPSAVDGVSPRDEHDPTRCYTRIIVKTRGDSSPQKAKLTFTFQHLEEGTTLNPSSWTKTGSSVQLLRSDSQATPPWAIYAVLFNFAEKAAGQWKVTVDVQTSTGIKKSKSIKVQVLTTTWPLVTGQFPNQAEVTDNLIPNLHGFSYFRPNASNPDLPAHRIPRQNENQGDGLDVHAGGVGHGRAPFSGKVTHRHQFEDTRLGYYIIIQGEVKTKTGTTVKLKAGIAHLTPIVKVGDPVCVGQPLGDQKTQSILHLELYNPDHQLWSRTPVVGDESKLPGGKNRTQFDNLSKDEKKKVIYWRPATAYHQTLLTNIRAVLLNKTFGH